MGAGNQGWKVMSAWGGERGEGRQKEKLQRENVSCILKIEWEDTLWS